MDVWMTFQRHGDTTAPNKLYHSIDGGKSFSTLTGVDDAEFLAFGKGETPSNPAMYLFGRVMGASHDTMYQSLDMGKSWVAISDPAISDFPNISDLTADMRLKNIVYVGTGGRGVIYGKE
jgi:hypothetical protein